MSAWLNPVSGLVWAMLSILHRRHRPWRGDRLAGERREQPGAHGRAQQRAPVVPGGQQHSRGEGHGQDHRGCRDDDLRRFRFMISERRDKRGPSHAPRLVRYVGTLVLPFQPTLPPFGEAGIPCISELPVRLRCARGGEMVLSLVPAC